MKKKLSPEVEAALRVLSDTRPEEFELMDDIERQIYLNSKIIVADYYNLMKNPKIKEFISKIR